MMRSIGKARRWMVQQLPRTYRATARTVGTVSGRDARRSVRLLREEVTRLRERAYANGFSVPSSEHVAVLDCLGPRELSVRSQNGEDGVIQALLGVTGVGNRTFFEIGVEAGRECNTRALAEFRGWSGTMVDGDKAKVVAGRAEHARERQIGRAHV